MIRYHIPEHKGERLFEAILEPSAPTIIKLIKSRDVGAGQIETIQGKLNKVAVGTPIFARIAPEDIGKQGQLTDEIKRMFLDYDFHWLSLSCSIEPDPDCIFTWVRFGVELLTMPEFSTHDEKAIAWSIFPEELSSEIKCERIVQLSPELTLELATVKAGGKLGSRTTKESFTVYEPQIYASGFRRSQMAWNFKATEQKGVWGDKRDLLLTVRAPKGSRLKGRFIIGAEVRFNIGKWIRVPLFKREDRVVDDLYDLSA